MEKRLKKLNRMYETNARKLAVCQAVEEEILQERTEIHNTMMLQMLTEQAVTPAILKEMLEKSRTQAIVPKYRPEQEEQDDE